ncbi:hypothetical protein ACN9MU_21965 [Pseudoduganella sp. R-32]|uniref:hypothetical protein n=1 Tax=Pseudoduganella sp. R-32 TaxID=3404061 RepID=UPI003CF50942
MVNRKWYSHPVLLTGIAINLFALILAVSVKGSPEQLMRVLTEDGIVEWLQFLCFAMTAGLLVFAGVERWKRSGFDLATLGMLGLGLLVAAAAMEEISWFQRILHVQSSEFFAHNNRQGETNLHNLAIGKSGSIHKTIMLKMILLAGLTHNVILPLLARTRPAVRNFVEKFGVYLPPLPVSLVYLVLVALSHVLIDHPRKGELGELFGAVHYMSTIFAAYFLGFGYNQSAVFQQTAEARLVDKLFSCVMVFLLLTAWLLSAGAGAMMG